MWWFVILARGKVHFQIMPDAWKQAGRGMAYFVNGLEPTLRHMLGSPGRLPRVVLSDRGPGFYQSSTGHIVKEYEKALNEAGFRPFAGADASWQPADLPDVFPHETVAGWCRSFFSKHPFARTSSLEENQRRFTAVLTACEEHINAEYAVGDLCRSFPERLRELVDAEGGRLRH